MTRSSFSLLLELGDLGLKINASLGDSVVGALELSALRQEQVDSPLLLLVVTLESVTDVSKLRHLVLHVVNFVSKCLNLLVIIIVVFSR